MTQNKENQTDSEQSELKNSADSLTSREATDFLTSQNKIGNLVNHNKETLLSFNQQIKGMKSTIDSYIKKVDWHTATDREIEMIDRAGRGSESLGNVIHRLNIAVAEAGYYIRTLEADKEKSEREARDAPTQ